MAVILLILGMLGGFIWVGAIIVTVIRALLYRRKVDKLYREGKLL